METSEQPFVSYVSRHTIVVWERGLWGREVIELEEHREHWGRGAAYWTITYGSNCWVKSKGQFTSPETPEERAETRYTSVEAAMPEAQRAAAWLMDVQREQVEKYDAAQAAGPLT
jgi:hypothetical protein